VSVDSMKGSRGPLSLLFLFSARHAKAFRNAYRFAFLSGVSAPARIRAFRSWCLTLLLVVPSLVWATHGGPELCEVLGWDPVDRKVFILRHNWSEGDAPQTLVYFDLKWTAQTGGWPCPKQTVVPWSRESVRGDLTFPQRLNTIRKRLQPLKLVEPNRVMYESRVLAADTLRDSLNGSIPRFRVEIHLPGLEDVPNVVRVTTYVTPEVTIPRVYEFDDSSRLAIVSFRGIPWETGYECQVPVLIETCNRTFDVEWKGYGK